MLWELSLVLFLGYLMWDVMTERYRDVPGPPRWPIVGNAFAFVGYTQEELFRVVTDMHKRYGPRYVVKIFNEYVIHVCGVEDVEVVLASSKNISKNKPYDFLRPWLGKGLLLSTGNQWHARRKILTPAFHFNVLEQYLEVFQEYSRASVRELKRIVQENSNAVDLRTVVGDFTLHTICNTAMGTNLNYKFNVTKNYKDAILNIGCILVIRLASVWMHCDYIFNALPFGRELKKHLKSAHGFVDNIIAEKKKMFDANGGGKRMFLDLLLEAERRGDIGMEDVRDEVNTFVFEGYDTTAAALTLGLALLADHEDVQERIYEECTSILGPDRAPLAADLAGMKYLEAVVKEILRLYPSVPFISRLIDQDFVMNDLLVRKGTHLVVHIYDVHRGPSFPEPEQFRPERFLRQARPYSYVPFSAGPRNCIGQKFAKMEMKCFLCEIIRNFKLTPRVKGAKPTLKADFVLRSVQPIYVVFKPR